MTGRTAPDASDYHRSRGWGAPDANDGGYSSTHYFSPLVFFGMRLENIRLASSSRHSNSVHIHEYANFSAWPRTDPATPSVTLRRSEPGKQNQRTRAKRTGRCVGQTFVTRPPGLFHLKTERPERTTVRCYRCSLGPQINHPVMRILRPAVRLSMPASCSKSTAPGISPVEHTLIPERS